MRIGFIGAGKVGKALGLYFMDHGLPISGYCSRTLKSAREAAALTASRAFRTLETLAEQSDIVFITAPDQTLAAIDEEAAAMIRKDSGKTTIPWIHVSGAHPSDCLAALKKAGCPVGSMHPLQSFGEPVSSAARLPHTWVTIEGTEQAIGALKTILDQTGGNYSRIEAEQKPLYHAGACVVSNYLVTLLESGIRYFEAAAMDRDTIIKAIAPLIDATLSNIREKGTLEALTGPIVRGDLNTVRVHLQTLETRLPSELGLYKTLALKTAAMLEAGKLAPGQLEACKRMLEEETHAS